MKVLHILNSLLPSGAETMLFSSADYWNADIEKHILATNHNIGEYAPELKKAGYIIHHVSNDSYLKQHSAVRKFIKENGFDVVHIHRQGEAFSYALDAKLAGVKTIVRTVHNVFVFHGVVQIREFIARQLACAIGVKHVAISKSVLNNECSRFRIRCIQIDNWYDENRFFFTTEELKRQARLTLGLEADAFCIISVGNCTPVKNHMSILKMMVRYKDDPKFSNVTYLHLGHGNQEDEEKKYAVTNGIQDRVKFYGFSDPVKYLQASDLFVMPSTYEGFGISGIEGLATGVKTIFTDVAGLRDFSKFGFQNLCYCKLDDYSVTEAIYDAVIAGKPENSITQARKIRELFGIEVGVKKYQELYYNGLLHQKSNL